MKDTQKYLISSADIVLIVLFAPVFLYFFILFVVSFFVPKPNIGITFVFLALSVISALPFLKIFVPAKEKKHLKYCTRCGSEIVGAPKFCRWCGISLEDGIISYASQWKSEIQNFREKSAVSMDIGDFKITQYQYDLLKYLIYPKQKNGLSKIEYNETLILLNKGFVEVLEGVKYKTTASIETEIKKIEQVRRDQENQEKNNAINELINNPLGNEEFKNLLVYGCPRVVDFLTYNDFKFVVLLKMLEERRAYKEIKKLTDKKEYKYEKFDWGTCAQCFRQYVFFKKWLDKEAKEYKESNINYVKLACIGDCECCKNVKNKKIPLDEVFELPRPECEHDVDLCKMALFQPVIE